MNKLLCILIESIFFSTIQAQTINRSVVVSRNNPHITSVDTLASLTIGNGHFAATVDATGLQTFPEYYQNGVPLGTMSDWGWHAFPNPNGYQPEEALEAIDFGRGHQELYANQFKQPGRQHDAAEWLRNNPHRLHLGCLGFNFSNPQKVTAVSQTLDLLNGLIRSKFAYQGKTYQVKTVCAPDRDLIATDICAEQPISLTLQLPYPTGGHSDDGCNWKAGSRHQTTIVSRWKKGVLLRHTLDSTTYYVRLTWNAPVTVKQQDAAWNKRQNGHNGLVLTTSQKTLSLTCEFLKDAPSTPAVRAHFPRIAISAAIHWQRYWTTGGIVDFSHCNDPRAKELERRVVLSQYLMYAQEAGDTPPQETGLTYNSWFGKFHLEMEWWHQAHFALWGHPEILDHTLEWYFQAEPKAREIAQRQGFKGVRWMKMTDPSAAEAPSKVGSFLIWQQPHLIYLAELLRRAGVPNTQTKYLRLVDETADFMQSFATFDADNDRYILKGCIPAQETLKAHEVVNPPFELNYWLWALQTAQNWHQDRRYQSVIDKLSPLAFNADSLYLAAASATDTYRDIRFTSDHPALLGAYGILPDSRLIDKKVMTKTLDWIWDNWNWDKTWGWDYPMVAMTAARLQQPERAVDALLMDKRTNTYLPNGHNYQDQRLRVYMPGNGGLLTAVAMMCAGWDGSEGKNPGFPADWDVRWEGLRAMP